MTIQNTTIRKAGPSQGNGVTTVFPFTFKVFLTSEILVTYLDALDVESVLVLSTNYTVSLNADQNTSPGGSVTLLVAPATATYITLTSQVTNTQNLSLTNSGGFYPQSINDALDRTVIQVQQIAEVLVRCITVAVSSSQTPAQLLASIYASAASAISAASSASASSTSASSSASSASTSATTASTGATTATAQAVIATTGASTATAQASTATTMASTATTEASTATTQANSASASASTATTGASIATTQAGIATTGANTATTQAGIATTQASNAAASAASAAGFVVPSQTGNTGKYLGTNGSSTSWSLVSGGATGGGSDQVFVENAMIITTNYTLSSGKSASSVGAITINSGVAVTVPSGSRWVVL